MELDKQCLKIDKLTARAMIEGYRNKDGRLIHQSIWVATYSMKSPRLIILNNLNRKKYPPSPLGNDLYREDFSIPYKFIAELDSVYPVGNDKSLWDTICSNGLFDIWDPQAPSNTYSSERSGRSIQLLRIYEINKEYGDNDLRLKSNWITHLQTPSRTATLKRPIIDNDEFARIKALLVKSVSKYLIKPTSEGKAEPIIANEDDESAFPEGRERYGKHRYLERDGSIPRKAKAKRLADTGSLRCDVCGFDFVKTYGAAGIGFIEAHHTKLVSALAGSEKTKISDLALVCSNCHRMLHRGKQLLTVEQLREICKEHAIT